MDLCFFGTSGAIPTAQDGNLSFAVRSDDTSLLVDLSGNPVQNLLRSGIAPLTLDAVIMTHAHPDHLYALPALIHTLRLLKRDKPLLMLTNAPTARRAEELLRLFDLLDREDMFELDWRIGTHKAVPISSLSGQLFPVEHSLPTSGIRIESGSASVVFSADTAPCPAVTEIARGCSALIHEASGPATRSEQLNQAGHSTGVQAGEIAARAGVGTLFLCHFERSADSTGSTPEQMKTEAAEKFSGAVVIPEVFRHYRIEGRPYRPE